MIRRTLRAVARLLSWTLAAALLYGLVTFGQVWWTAGHDTAAPADAIVVLGAAHYQGTPSPVFRARLDHAADLYARDLAPVVVVTGGRQPGDEVSEARAADAYLQRLGVPDTALRLEVDGTTSYESLAASARFLQQEGIREVILVSDGWHLRRSAAIARSVGLVPRTSPTPTSVYSTTGALSQMARETVGLAVGRIIGFRRLDNLSALTVADALRGVVRS